MCTSRTSLLYVPAPPVWSRAYSSVSSQVTLCGSCLAKKSSAAGAQAEGQNQGLGKQTAPPLPGTSLCATSNTNSRDGPHPRHTHTCTVRPAVPDQRTQVVHQPGEGGRNLAALARAAAEEGHCTGTGQAWQGNHELYSTQHEVAVAQPSPTQHRHTHLIQHVCADACAHS